MKRLLLIAAILLLFAAEILRVYFIMPFPGSQQSNTIDFAYFLDKYLIYIRIVCILIIVFALYKSFPNWRRWQKGLFFFAAFLYGMIFYFFNFKFLADKMFYQPRHKNFAQAAANKVSTDKLIVGVSINGEAKAYPIEIIGYHHQVQDTVGDQPIMVTYCSVCRTGRVYSPLVNGKKETFRLVGMDHFNAMFEDKTTSSWWQQATGVAITGPLKNKKLTEIPSQQMTLSAWLRQNPNSFILQPDPDFKKQYDDLIGFDNGTIKSSLEKRDSASWKFKSWVIGVANNGQAKAFDWNELMTKKLINDSVGGIPIVIVAEPDGSSFHAWSRKLNNQIFLFSLSDTGQQLKDISTGTTWNFDGICVDGPFKNQKLIPVQVSQEFWHSWQTFHPGGTVYKSK
jgi:Protein of unknown function (DUF3179)